MPERVVKRAYRYRCYPTAQQAVELSRTFGCVRLVYNRAPCPRPARPRPWHYVILVLNFVFFGFFFVNFVADFIGDPLITF